MPNFTTIAQFETALDKAIDNAMVGRVLDGVKEQIATSVQEDVYDVYNPKFYSRFGASSGMKDKDYMVDHYDSPTKTLEVRHEALWQHLKGGIMPQEDLTDVVERGEHGHKNRAYMYGAPARPYISEAEQTYAKSSFEIDLDLGLRDQGF